MLEGRNGNQMRTSMVIFSVMICISSLTIASKSFANDKFVICIGEARDKCPSADAQFGCGTAPDDAALAMCTVTAGGQRKTRSFHIVPQSTFAGGRCGYGVYSGECAK